MATEAKQNSKEKASYSVKDLFTENPRWCVGCGDFSIVMTLKRFMVNNELLPHQTVNVSGIGCSGRTPYYIDSYGVHAIHGRAIPVSLGLVLARPELNLFIHSGDGDALSIGGNHLIHGVNKNFNCVFLLYDNELYALTKSQTSPTTRKGHKTNTQPTGTYLDPLKATKLVLGIGASFVASTADWMPDHMMNTIDAAFKHKGFSFVHISQRCPHFDPDNFDHKTSTWFSFLKHDKGIPPDKRIADKTEIVNNDPTNLVEAFKLADSNHTYFGLFFCDPNKPRYDEILFNQIKDAEPKTRTKILDSYEI